MQSGSQSAEEIQDLKRAFEEFTRSTETLEAAYRSLQERVQDLDRELAEKNRDLALTTEYLNSILDSMSDGVIAWDDAGTITTFNRAASGILRYAPDAVLGRPFRHVFHREPHAPPGRQAMELRALDGARVPVSEQDAPIADRSGNRIGTVKVFQDLREIEALRERVRQKDRLAALGEMAATVAHEIRNPLGGIRGFAALLARDLDTDDPRLRLVEKVQTGAKDLERVVTELLEYTRPLELRLRPVDCTDLADSALGYVAWPESGVDVLQDIATGAPVMADPDKLRQVLINLLLNARQSLEGPGTISISAVESNGYVRISVQDTGCGFDKGQAGRMFSPFYTTKEKGTGLGLAVALKIVEAHGGTIEAESEIGAGSVFTLVLPRHQA